MNKSLLTFFVLAALKIIALPAYGKDSGPTITHGRIFKLADFLNVHSSSDYWLKIGNKRFNNVAGFEPFYVPIKDLKAVFFVTNPWNQKMAAHIFLLQEKRDIEFPIYYEGFDSYCLGQPVSARGAVIVEKVAPPIVIIKCKRDLVSDSFEFNIQTSKCSKIQK